MQKSIKTLDSLREICESSPHAPDHQPLLARLREAAPDLEFSPALERGGWRRIGGVILSNGDRIAADMRVWAETTLDEIGPDMALPENAEAYRATRIDGRTLYLVAPTGPDAWDFVQLALEILTEVVERELFPADFAPLDIEEFIDPAEFEPLAPTLLDGPRYHVHHIEDIARLRETLDPAISTNRRFARFLDEWQASRARTARFCDHYVLRLFGYLDRFGEHKTEATPLARDNAALPDDAMQAVGSDLARILDAYDRQVGHPMAWYFQVLTAQKPFHRVIEQVYRDHDQGGFGYIGDRDLAIIENWIGDPYCF